MQALLLLEALEAALEIQQLLVVLWLLRPPTAAATA